MILDEGMYEFKPGHSISYKTASATSEDSDQPAYDLSLSWANM